MKPAAASLLGLLALFTTSSATAQTASTVQSLIVDDFSHLKGMAKFGTLGQDVNMDGFRIEVLQAPVNRLRQVWHPAVTHSWSVLTPIMGDIDTSYDEEIGHTEYDHVEVTPYVPGYYATEEYEIPGQPAQHNLITPATPPEYGSAPDYNANGIADDGTVDLDGDGFYESIVTLSGTEAVYEDIPEVPPSTGTRSVWVDEVAATYRDDPRWVVDSIIRHAQSTWGQIGEERVDYSEILSAAHFSSELIAGDDSPVARFTGTHPEMSFTWSNWTDLSGTERRELMTLSSGGLLLPNMSDSYGYAKASLSQDTFEQSWTGPEYPTDGSNTLAYHSFGSKMEKGQIKVWNHGGDYVAVNGSTEDEAIENIEDKNEATVAADGILIEKSNLANGVSNAVQATHITAEFATFGGSVAVKGVLRVPPAGNLSMGSFQGGPNP